MMGSHESGAAVERFRASPHQRHLWALDRLDPTGPFRTQARVRIDGVLDEAALERAIIGVVRRHEILRTTFATAEQLEQVLGDGAPGWRVHDLTSLPADARQAAVNALDAELVDRGFDYANGPALQATLCRLAPDAHVLLLHAPAYCCDGRGLANLVGEISRALDDPPARKAPEGETLQYVEASIWMNESLEAPETAVARQFWQRQDLSGGLGRRLPCAMRTPAVSGFAPARIGHRMIPALRIAAEPFLLTLWRTLLERHNDDTPVVVGCLADLRGYDELQSAVGLFARVLPIASDLDSTAPFQLALRQTQDSLNDARQWGEAFDWAIVRGVDQVERSARYASFAFEYRQWPSRFIAKNGVTFVCDTRACIDRFDLKLVAADVPAGVQWWIEYDAAIYRSEDIERLGREFDTLVTDASHRPMTPVGDLDVLSSQEQDAIVRALNPNGGAVAVVDCVHTLFEACAAATPASPAVACDGTVLTYGELNARANRVARRLRTLGVGADVLVAVYLERSTDLIVSILATLKAGGAYVPLDPDLPLPRLQAILDDSRAPVVIVEHTFPGVLRPGVSQLSLGSEAASLAAESAADLERTSRPEHLAYVLFTSGSTGRPKGVAIEHRQLVSYTRAVTERLALPAMATCASVTTLASDLGNTAIFPALTNGGCLHLITSRRAADPAALAEYFAGNRIDVLKIVPSHLKALLSVDSPARVLPRERLVFGGEALSWDLVASVRQLAPDCRIFNHYGPTETTVGATVFDVLVDGEAGGPSLTVPIGKPLAHARAYVVDRKNRHVPVWGAGELLIGGAGVARGYLHAPELTADRFVADPFASDDGARVYRTGDLVRVLPSGDLEFLGRLDDQVKIRGYRVEPGEIAAAIRRLTGVKDAVVLVRHDGQEKRLIAFVVPGNASANLDGEVSARLRPELPDYMVPSSIVTVEAIPLTANGKVDRSALLTLSATPRIASSSPSPFSTPWERLVADVWRQLLSLDDISTQDNFYDLGGHSLLAIQVVAAIEKRTGLKIGPRDLAFSTLKQFAARCESRLPHLPEATPNSP